MIVGVLLVAGPAMAKDPLCDKKYGFVDQVAPMASWEYERDQGLGSEVCDHDDDPQKQNVQDAYWLDRLDKPASEIGRLHFVANCLPDALKGEVSRQNVMRVLAHLGNCSADARKLDKGKVSAELKALGANPETTKAVLEHFDAVKARADRYVAEAKKSDDGKKFLLEGYDAAWAEWEKIYQEEKKLFELAWSVGDKAARAIKPGSDQIAAVPMKVGCEELRGALREHVQSKKPKTAAEARAALTDAAGVVALERLTLCDAREGRYVDAGAAMKLLQTAATYSGPRVYAMRAVAKAAVLEKEKRSLDFWEDKLTGLKQTAIGSALEGLVGNGTAGVSTIEGGDGQNTTGGDQFKIEQGKIAAVKKKGDGVEITFKSEKWWQPEWECKQGHFLYYGGDGRPLYASNCKEIGGHIETFSLDPRIVLTPGVTLKAGQIVKLSTGKHKPDEKTNFAFIVEADEAAPKGKKGLTPLAYWGVPLK
jgi:hypothetical protein